MIKRLKGSGFVFLLRYYIASAVPDSVMDSARVDDLNEFGIFNRTVFPMIAPAFDGFPLGKWP